MYVSCTYGGQYPTHRRSREQHSSADMRNEVCIGNPQPLTEHLARLREPVRGAVRLCP